MADEVEVVEKGLGEIYIIVLSNSDHPMSLEKKVDEKILEGYYPLGGVCVNTMGIYVQAMVREDLKG